MSAKIKVRVFHDFYGCETGCCGHTVELTLPDGKTKEQFDFAHPGWKKDAGEWAREHAEDVIRRRWPDCVDSIDWESMDVEDATDNCW